MGMTVLTPAACGIDSAIQSGCEGRIAASPFIANDELAIHADACPQIHALHHGALLYVRHHSARLSSHLSNKIAEGERAESTGVNVAKILPTTSGVQFAVIVFGFVKNWIPSLP